MSKKRNVSTKNLVIITLLGFIITFGILNIYYLNHIYLDISTLTFNEKINSLRDASLRKNLQPISQEEFAKIKEEIKRLSNQQVR